MSKNSIMTSPPLTTKKPNVKKIIGVALLTRIFTDTGMQIFFPFLSVIASGMGVSAVRLGQLTSLRNITGLFSPFFGALADRIGFRLVMQFGLINAGIGMFIFGTSNSLWQAALGMLVIGIGSFAFVPALQAYMSAQLPYQIRARGMGIVEWGWALSGIIGAYTAGLLIDLSSWRLPFFVLGGALIGLGIGYRWLPQVARDSHAPPPNWRFWELDGNTSAWANVVVTGLLMYSGMHIFITYGLWFSTEYGLTALRLGTLALLLGITDLVGSSLVSLFTDWFGKWRSVFLGLMMMVATFPLLLWLDQSLVWVMVGLGVVRFAFEFSFVSNFCLFLVLFG
jgi:predicted MFS family arabinose efflux permease